MTKNITGIMWMLIHVIAATTLSIYYRILSESFDKLHISFFCNFSALIIILPLLIRRKARLIKSCFLALHALRGAFSVLAQVILIFAYNNNPFAQVSAITLSYPLFGTLGAVIFLKEKIGIHRSIALIIGFIGATITVDANPYDFNKYSIITIISMILWVSFDIITNKIGDKESIWEQALLILLFVGLFSILPAAMVPLPKNISLNHIMLFVLLGLIVIVYTMSAILAVAKAEINIVLPCYFTILPVSTLVSYFVFNEQIKIRIIIGSALIITSATYIAYREYRAKQIAKQLQQSRLI